MSRRTKAYNKAKHVVVDALQHIVREVPSVTEKFYWGGTGAIAYDECPMKNGRPVLPESIDIDLIGRRAHEDVSREIDAIIAAIKATGSRWDRNFFTGEFTHTGIPVLIQVSGAFEDCPPGHLVNSQVVPGLSRIRIEPYIVGKVRCLAERNEIKDWWHLALLADCDPRYESLIFRTVAQWDDPALLVGRAKLLDPTDVRQLGGAARDCDLIDAFRLRVLSCFTPVAIDAPVP